MQVAKAYFQRVTIFIRVSAMLTFLLLVVGCQVPATAQIVPMQHTESQAQTADTSAHAVEVTDPRPESTQASPIALDPSTGQEIGAVYEAWLSPHQEGGEEEDTPEMVPAAFKSTEPSVVRNERLSRGHGVLSFTQDLSKAYVHVSIENIAPEDIVMFHIHCGRPGQLGPIIIDFSLIGDLQEYWADNQLTLEIRNEDIEAVTNHAEGFVGAFTAGCPIVATVPLDKVKTIGGMAAIAREGELYFNLHTKGQTFFGDIRGQLYEVK